jgi:hypothetical protein
MGRDLAETPWKAEEASANESLEVPANRALPGRRVAERVDARNPFADGNDAIMARAREIEFDAAVPLMRVS